MSDVLTAKRCTKCGGAGPFYRDRAATDGLQSRCKACRNAIVREWKERHPEETKAITQRERDKNREGYKARKRTWSKKSRAKARAAARKWAYGVTAEQVRMMLEAQHHACAICGLHIRDSAEGDGRRGARSDSVHLDHDHQSGRVRGLLCHGCNTGLGMLRDNPEVLRKAIRYLETHLALDEALR